MQEARQVVDIDQIRGCFPHERGEKFFGHLGAANVDPLYLYTGMLALVGGYHAVYIVGKGIA